MYDFLFFPQWQHVPHVPSFPLRAHSYSGVWLVNGVEHARGAEGKVTPPDIYWTCCRSITGRIHWQKLHGQENTHNLDMKNSTQIVAQLRSEFFFFSNFPYFVLNHPYSIRKRKKIVIAVVGLILHGNIFLVLMVLFLASFFFFFVILMSCCGWTLHE